MNKHNSPLSNTLLGALIEAGRWIGAFFVALAALAYLMIAGMRDE